MDIALQKAKIEFIETSSKENQMPYYWAAAILAGKTDAIEFNKTGGMEFALIGPGLVVLTLTGFIVWFRFRKKRHAGKQGIL